MLESGVSLGQRTRLGNREAGECLGMGHARYVVAAAVVDCFMASRAVHWFS